MGNNQAKIEKISISQAIWLGFLRSLVSAIQCEANKSNLWREERPIGLRAVRMLSDLQQRASCLAQHVAADLQVNTLLKRACSFLFSHVPSSLSTTFRIPLL